MTGTLVPTPALRFKYGNRQKEKRLSCIVCSPPVPLLLVLYFWPFLHGLQVLPQFLTHDSVVGSLLREISSSLICFHNPLLDVSQLTVPPPPLKCRDLVIFGRTTLTKTKGEVAGLEWGGDEHRFVEIRRNVSESCVWNPKLGFSFQTNFSIPVI